MQVHELWRYPVKSMGGEQCAELTVEDRGVVADRLWAVVDADGKLGSGKNSRRFRRMDGLLGCRARLEAGATVITLPDGEDVRVGEEYADRAVRSALGRDDVRLARESTVAHHDAAPLHVVTDASLAAIRARVRDAAVETRRFRPNVVVRTGLPAGFVEDDWVGCRATIGAVLVEFTKGTERCVMVNAAQPGLVESHQVLNEVSAANDLAFGVYARVLRPGVIRDGDVIHLR